MSKIILTFTNKQYNALIEALTTLEGMAGSGGDPDEDNSPFDEEVNEMKKDMKRMFKSNGIKHPFND